MPRKSHFGTFRVHNSKLEWATWWLAPVGKIRWIFSRCTVRLGWTYSFFAWSSWRLSLPNKLMDGAMSLAVDGYHDYEQVDLQHVVSSSAGSFVAICDSNPRTRRHFGSKSIYLASGVFLENYQTRRLCHFASQSTTTLEYSHLLSSTCMLCMLLFWKYLVRLGYQSRPTSSLLSVTFALRQHISTNKNHTFGMFRSLYHNNVRNCRLASERHHWESQSLPVPKLCTCTSKSLLPPPLRLLSIVELSMVRNRHCAIESIVFERQRVQSCCDVSCHVQGGTHFIILAKLIDRVKNSLWLTVLSCSHLIAMW